MFKEDLSYYKLFFYIFSQRRHYIPLLAIYFLTLDNTTAQQIGLYTGIGFLLSFLFEVPSGYISDRIGHKYALVISKILMLISTLFFIFGDNVYYFILGSVGISLSWSFQSGSLSAYIHNHLKSQNKEDTFTRYFSKMRGDVSLLSAIAIFTLPFTTHYDILIPFYIALVLDLLGLFVLLTLPKSKQITSKEEHKSIFEIIKEAKNLHICPFIFFFGILSGLMQTDSTFRAVYVESLGLPLVLIGSMMAGSRLIWFLMGRFSHIIEAKYSMHSIMKFEIVFFSLGFITVATLSNPYIIAVIMIVYLGYTWGRDTILQNYILKTYVKDQRYKATVLSLQSQVSFLMSGAFPFLFGYIMALSYSLGYYIMALTSLLLLPVIYIFIKK